MFLNNHRLRYFDVATPHKDCDNPSKLDRSVTNKITTR